MVSSLCLVADFHNIVDGSVGIDRTFSSIRSYIINWYNVSNIEQCRRIELTNSKALFGYHLHGRRNFWKNSSSSGKIKFGSPVNEKPVSSIDGNYPLLRFPRSNYRIDYSTTWSSSRGIQFRSERIIIRQGNKKGERDICIRTSHELLISLTSCLKDPLRRIFIILVNSDQLLSTCWNQFKEHQVA